MSKQQCEYCGTAVDANSAHKATCLTMDKNPAWAIAEWKKGFDKGFEDLYIPYYWHFHSSPWIRGYEKGRDLIQDMVESAWESRMNSVGEREY